MLINTLDEIFKGNEVLFKDLYIHDKWDWNDKYPVIKLDLSKIENQNPQELKKELKMAINDIAEEFSIKLSDSSPQRLLDELIRGLYNNFNKKVVVLVDEYDTPLIDVITDENTYKKNRDILAKFFKILKTNDEYIKFIFLTGVSKIANLSLFSGLNSPDDITLDDRFALLCGYSEDELKDYFKEYIDTVRDNLNLSFKELMDHINYWYNGYSWDGKNKVYNPSSTLKLFSEKYFSNYWFTTGTPNFLMEQIKKNNNLNLVLKPITLVKDDLDSFNPNNFDVTPLLFQTGYISIKKVEIQNLERLFTLDFPNHEVKVSFFKKLLTAYSTSLK
ncbi:putative AAA-ATPase [Methanobrevibacter curvatus]|uniref:Putative AAA-ATPase n=1 Tax=Methanobrevibacter curvatus TaxID=49547 RepID=A0A166AVU9_9EURY|nr:putative AAA-ATPase [Methanobrevibacter curvatus]